MPTSLSAFLLTMSERKRKRSPNWHPDEKMLLLNLIENHFCVIDNKKTDSLAMQRKLAEWKIISEEYNSLTTHYHRTPEILRTQWKGMKSNAKKEIGAGNTSGGGIRDPVHDKVMALLKKSAELHDTLDSDIELGFPENVTDTVSETGQMSESEHLSESDGDVTDFIDNEQPISITLANDCNGKGVQEVEDYPQLVKTKASSLKQDDVSQASKKKTNKSKNSIWLPRRQSTHSSASSSLDQLYRKKIETKELKRELANKEMQQSNTISSLDILIKKEILKQERIKTRILLVELRLKKKQL